MIRGGCFKSWYVQKRPHVDRLLTELAKNYKIIVFTAATKDYADAILDKLDVNNVIDVRLYRDSCTRMGRALVKDLAKLGQELKNVILVDDNPVSYKLQPENAFPVEAFTGDLSDKQLLEVIDFCDKATTCKDMREAIWKHRNELKIVID
ncbi:hypothetical protein SUGI_0247580 [Cryptomeria japonica]|nr:hypothetical protein SUGI_0247580 [Cryptomeria japonica]